MSIKNGDVSRRNFLVTTTCVVGGIGIGLIAIPFVGSWLPSAQAMAMGGPVDVDLTLIAPGKKITISWRGKPVFVVHRTESALIELGKISSRLRDPESSFSEQPLYAKNLYRSSNRRFFVVIGVCTHLGCVPIYHPTIGKLEQSWVGGFYCPCHGSKFDLSGRVYKGVPAPVNLSVPPYRFISENILRVGDDEKG